MELKIEPIPPFMKSRKPIDLSAACAIGNPPQPHDWLLPELSSATRPRVSEAGTLLPSEKIIYYRWFCGQCNVYQDIAEVAPNSPRNYIPRSSINMEIEDAVRILNENKHEFYDVAEHITITWVIEKDSFRGEIKRYALLITYITEYEDKEGSRGERDIQSLSEFEAIAIAERYLRERKA